MTEIVYGVGASHTTLMNTKWDEVDHLDRAHAFRDGLGEARRRLADATPDVCVIVGSNHFRGFWLDLMPPFTLGVDAVSAVGEHGTPSGPLPVRPDLAQTLQQGLLDRDFDVAMSTDLEVDHGISHAVQYVVPEGVPIIPLIINVFGPPLPTLRRCLALGAAVRDVLAALDGPDRIAVIGTGGLSHAIPFPDWRTAEGPAEEFMADSFRHGRGRWRELEEQRRPLVVGAEPRLAEDFDHELLDLLEAGSLAGLGDRFANDELVAAAGNGGNEVRAWLVMAAALGHAPGERLVYSPMPEWLTGMAVAVIDPTREAPL
ncbi:MAG: catechol 1,2-dioxygenase [Actinomycetota bacterium]